MADFATIEELEVFMGTSDLGDRGTAMLGYASALIRRSVGMDIEETLGRQEQFAADPLRESLVLSQIPVTAVAIDVDGSSFTEFSWDRWTGQLYRNDGGAWTTGPITIVYDSGYEQTSDEMIAARVICLEVAKRALAPDGQAFGAFPPSELGEGRGMAGELFLTAAEFHELEGLGRVPVA